MSEQETKGRHQATDPETWVDGHGDAMFRFAMLRVRNRDLAEEMVQEALLAGFRSRHRYSGKAAERTWLIQILRNKIADHYRRKQREITATDIAGDEGSIDDFFSEHGRWEIKPGPWEMDPGEMMHREDFLRILRECMAGLPERQAEVFSLKVLDEHSTKDVCSILSLTKTNLGVLLHRARMKLRKCLESNWFEAA